MDNLLWKQPQLLMTWIAITLALLVDLPIARGAWAPFVADPYSPIAEPRSLHPPYCLDNKARGLLQVTASGMMGSTYGIIDEADFLDEAPNSSSMDNSSVELPVGDAACWFSGEDVPVGVHVNTTCPNRCPFSQRLAGETCWKACLQAGECNKVHSVRTFADKEIFECTPACGSGNGRRVGGCIDCNVDGRCSTCVIMHTPSSDGSSCLNDYRRLWFLMYSMLAFTLFAMACYLMHLCCLPKINDELVALGLAHRRRCLPCLPQKADAVASSDVWQPYSLRDTKVWADDVSGLGVVLYFRWISFAVFCSVLLLAGTSCAYFVPVGVKSASNVLEDDQGCPVRMMQPPPANISLLEFRPRIRIGSPKTKFKLKSKSNQRVNRKKRSTGLGSQQDEFVQPAGDLNEYPARMSVCMSIIYVLFTGLSLRFALLQRRFASTWKSSRPLHQRYAIRTSGLPKSMIDPADVRRLFQEILDEAADEARDDDHTFALTPEELRVVGASIAYHIRDHTHVVEDGARQILESLDNPRRSICGVHDSTEHDDDHESPTRQWMRSPFTRVDNVLLPHASPRSRKVGKERTLRGAVKLVQEVLHDYEGTGVAFVVMSSISAVQLLLNPKQNDGISSGSIFLSRAGSVVHKRNDPNAAPPFLSPEGSVVLRRNSLQTTTSLPAAKASAPDGEMELRMRPVHYEPVDVLWGNCTAQSQTLRKKYVAFGALLYLGALALFMFLYIPYAVHYSVLQKVPEERTGFEDFILGGLVAAGNQVISLVTYYIVDRWIFIEKDRQDVVMLSLVFVGSFFNTFCDLGVIVYLGQGALPSNFIYGMTVHDGYDRAVANELFQLLFPGYLLVPIILAPVFENCLPRFVYCKLIGSSSTVTPSEAEAALAPPDFDICWRYADTLNFFMVSMLMLLFTSPNGYQLMMCLTGCMGLIFFIDWYRLLRMSQQTFYSTEALSNAFAYWWGLPTGLCGVIAIWWMLEAGFLDASVPVALLTFAMLHGVFYIGVMRRFVVEQPAVPGESVTYPEMFKFAYHEGRSYNYFNVNWAQILRARLLHKDSDHVAHAERAEVPYAKGKAYLQNTPPSQ